MQHLGDVPRPHQVAVDKRLIARERLLLEEHDVLLPPQCALPHVYVCCEIVRDLQLLASDQIARERLLLEEHDVLLPAQCALPHGG